MIASWLDVRELHDVVGEVLSKLIQHYGYQLLSQKRWIEAFDDFGREDMAKCVLADAAMLEVRYAELMADADGNETHKWQQIKTYIVAPLRAFNTAQMCTPRSVYNVAWTDSDNRLGVGRCRCCRRAHGSWPGWMDGAGNNLSGYI